MSGGVDSSVAAALTVAAGYDVLGVTLKLWSALDGSAPEQGCCTAEDADDARRVAHRLGIPHYTLNHASAFHDRVVGPFAAAYLAGETPNPCVECNRHVKFALLMEQASRLGCDVVVTGHHARIRRHGDAFRLLRATDRAKDQSYVLHMLGQGTLARLGFPVGEMTKADVRARAADLGLRTATKQDSQDLCFVRRDGVAALVESFAGSGVRSGGDVVDTAGCVLGRHGGVHRFTVGQRRGLGLGGGPARHVVEIDAARQRVVVGARDALAVAELRLRQPTWVAGAAPSGPVSVQVRAHAAAVPGRLADSARVVLDAPLVAAAPGQSAVLYDGEECLGGGVIASTRRAA